MIILVDLDGVICTEGKTFERSLAKPLPGAREALATLAKSGHTLIIYTARSWAELNMTKKWLDDNKISYHGIHMGKPIADKIIDDRAIAFNDWNVVLEQLQHTQPDYEGGPVDESLLYLLRKETKAFLEEISEREDILEPVLEVGPMSNVGSCSNVHRMPDTFVNTKELFLNQGKKYFSIDIEQSSNPDMLADIQAADDILGKESVGTVLLMNCLEHIPQVWDIPQILFNLLKSSGRAFILTPWNLRFHGPRPDCWRISDDGYQALFGERFEIESLQKIECPGRPLSPVGIKCVIRKK